MDNYLFLKLTEKVKECNSKNIQNYEFECENVTEGYFSAYFQIHERNYGIYAVEIESDNVFLTEDGNKIFRITGENAEKWLQLAKVFFQSKYEDKIEAQLYDDRYWNWIDNSKSPQASKQRNYSF